jgi:hypothetical protein
VDERVEVRQQPLAAARAGWLEINEPRMTIAGSHAGEPLRRAPHREKAVVEARCGQRGSNDLGHGRDPDVSHGALQLSGDDTAVHSDDLGHPWPDVLHDERVSAGGAVKGSTSVHLVSLYGSEGAAFGRCWGHGPRLTAWAASEQSRGMVTSISGAT